MFQFNIATCITILLSIIGCGYNRLHQEDSSDSNQGSTTPLIVCFNGLNKEASCFNSLKKELEKAFPAAFVVLLTSSEKERTFYNSIKEQASQSYNELSDQILDLRSRPTLLIGHSQGGLRAYSLFDRYKDALNVKGIITLATPWEGTPILSNQASFSQCWTRPVLDDMRRFSRALGGHIQWLEQYLMSLLENFKDASHLSGCNDLKIGSEFLAHIREKLPKEEVPILAIGGLQSDFRIFLPQKSTHDFKALRNAWTKIIVGKKDHNKNHDMTVPLYSQLALNIVPHRGKKFIRYRIKDALHDEILPLPPIKKSKNILAHPDMFRKVIEFGRSVLYQSNPKINKKQKALQISTKGA